MLKTLRLLLPLYVVLLAGGLVLLTALFALPTTQGMRRHAAESARQIHAEGLWCQPLGCFLLQTDNMTDAWMMNMCICADTDHPLQAVMRMEHVVLPDSLHLPDYRYRDALLHHAAVTPRAELAPMHGYPRYWHGYQVVLRPLLYVMNYKQMRLWHYGWLSVLLAAALWLLHRRLGTAYAATLGLALLCFGAVFVPQTFQCSTCFYLALGGLCAVLGWRRTEVSATCRIGLFFTLGALTAFADFLTTPLLTLALPLVACIALGIGHGMQPVRSIVQLSASWGGGYALMWSAKWPLAQVITGDGVIENALGQAAKRMGYTIVYGGHEMPLRHLIARLWQQPAVQIAVIVVAAGLLLALTWGLLWCRRHRAVVRQHGWLLLVGLMPLLWFLVLLNHSVQHIFYTWRTWLPALWCLLLFAWHAWQARRTAHTEGSEA